MIPISFIKTYTKVLSIVVILFIPIRYFLDNEFDQFYLWCIVHDFNLFHLIDIGIIASIIFIVMNYFHIKVFYDRRKRKRSLNWW